MTDFAKLKNSWLENIEAAKELENRLDEFVNTFVVKARKSAADSAILLSSGVKRTHTDVREIDIKMTLSLSSTSSTSTSFVMVVNQEQRGSYKIKIGEVDKVVYSPDELLVFLLATLKEHKDDMTEYFNGRGEKPNTQELHLA